jgi:hypothetical protein
MYAADHIRRVLHTFPGVFTGIGEFTIHKEFVSSKISGETASLTNPALDRGIGLKSQEARGGNDATSKTSTGIYVLFLTILWFGLSLTSALVALRGHGGRFGATNHPLQCKPKDNPRGVRVTHDDGTQFVRGTA